MMRITNKIIQNNSITNINGNKVLEDKLNTQLATGKKVNRPSDDPVVAIRALRLRTNLSEVEQYYTKNVPDAKSWLSITENALLSVTDVITNMYEDFASGSAGFKTTQDRDAILENLKGLRDEIYAIGNADYAGRYVFTGYRTDTSLSFTEDTTADYRGINDTFNASDVKRFTYIEGALGVDEINSLTTEGNDVTTVKEDMVNRIRLSYDNINGSVMRGPVDGFAGDEVGTISGWSTDDDYDKYFNEDGTIKPSGESFVGTISVGSDVLLKFHDPYDSLFSAQSNGIGAPDYFRVNSVEDPSLQGTASKTDDVIKVSYNNGNITFSITKDDSGKYIADNNADVKDNGDGTLKVTIHGPNGSGDIYTEITVKEDGSAVDSVYRFERIGDLNYWFEDDYAGVADALNGKVFGSRACDTTYLQYRTELPQNASIPQNSVNVDPVKGLESFEIQSGSNKYMIQSFPDEGIDGRWFAVDDSGDVISSIKVEQNTDGSFSVYVSTDGSSYWNHDAIDCDVFNVSADGKSVTSCYRQYSVEVKITDSTSSVATDADGNSLTAYQYLALDDDNKNEGDAADEVYLLADTGELVFGSNIADTLSGLKDIPGVDTISVIYDKSSFEKGDIRPEHYFDATLYDDNHRSLNRVVFDDHDQDINYSIGKNQTVRINTNASEAFDPQIARELDDIIDAITECVKAEENVARLKGMKADTLTYDEADQKKIDVLLEAAEKNSVFLSDRLQRMFERGLTSTQNFLDKANTALTVVGNRSARVDLVENRLQSQSTNFKTLSSENEDADITEVAVQLSSVEMSYQAALMATGRISQTTLLNYL